MNAQTPDTPVLLLAFNRPETTARVFDAIRKARPARLYVAADGPRAGHAGDAARCAEVRRIVSGVDWPCRLQTLFRDANLGCKRGVSTAIDWFFASEEQGIVLEDDCLPSASFFAFCGQLLQQHRDDPRVFSVQGNFFGAPRAPRASYLYSKMFYMWGWATWADRWRSVDVQDLDIEGIRRAIVTDGWIGPGAMLKDYWLDIVERQAAGGIDSWGYPVMLHCFKNKLFHATPARNLVLNIGDGPSATRTASLECGPFHKDALEMDFPLVHAAKYEGADALLPLEHRWRIQLTRTRLLRWWLQHRFPRAYRILKTVVGGLWPRRRAA